MTRLTAAAFAAALLCTGTAMAQTAPDAGRLLQENRVPPAPTPASPPLRLESPAAPSMTTPGGAAVEVRSVRVEGLTVVAPETVLAEVQPVAGRRLDLAGLRQVASQVQAAVRRHGLPFARAYLPPQDFADGALRVAVVEGRYGQVAAKGDRIEDAQPWLHRLEPDEPIVQGPLERSVLLLSDLPGVETQSVLRPGGKPGTGDLDVQVTARRQVSGEVGLDNHGNRYSGRNRLRAGVDVESPFLFGDQLSVRGSISDGHTTLGSVVYSLPIGTSGLRAQAAVSRADYELGDEFASLGAHGTADVGAIGLTYPIVRSRLVNVRAAAAVQAKTLRDERDAVQVSERRRSTSVPVSISADVRQDDAVTWGSVAYTQGDLHLDAALEAADAATARTAGTFSKVNVDLARVQAFGPALSAYGRVSAQWANKNLDSSEKFILGGATGVRGWPTGEAAGDEGWLAQVELRYRLGEFEPFVLADAGHVRINHSPWAAGLDARSLRSVGLGLRWATGPWSAELVAARRTSGDTPRSEPNAGRSRVWVNVGYRF